jgi:peptidoglycan/LPS O-acetylase OafA/YrhL
MPQLRLLGPGMLRFILAAMVVVSHLTSLNIGRPAVLLFFMLSGYWVSRLLAGWQASVPAFYVSRTLRVWPLYAVVTVLAWLLHAHAEAVRPESLWSALTLLGLAARAGDVFEQPRELGAGEIRVEHKTRFPMDHRLVLLEGVTNSGGAATLPDDGMMNRP